MVVIPVGPLVLNSRMLIDISKHDETTTIKGVFLASAGCVHFKELPNLEA